MPRHRADGADGQAVVAPQHDGQARLLEFGVNRVVQQLVPLHHLRQMAVPPYRRLPGVVRAAEVAAVLRIKTELRKGLHQPCHAQRLRPHAGTLRTRANVGGCANQADACGLGNDGRIHVTNANACKADCKGKFLRAVVRKDHWGEAGGGKHLQGHFRCNVPRRIKIARGTASSVSSTSL